MHQSLPRILEIQEFDMQMIQLMRLKRERQNELTSINTSKENLTKQVAIKQKENLDLKTGIRLIEGELNETLAKFKKLETQQGAIKKVEEFNALNQEMAQVERERVAKEQRLSESYDRLAAEESMLENLGKQLESIADSSKVLEEEIHESIARINEEGLALKSQRDVLAQDADLEVLRIYERLLGNKRDRVVVPIESRCCSGCHIMVTAQDENLVRKGEHLVFCEHCSRIHYWPESEALESTVVAAKPRRRRTTTTKV
jgi:predicted  nucleic acid-binding Zn-ribbon protein